MNAKNNNQQANIERLKVPSFEEASKVFKGKRFEVYSFKTPGPHGQLVQRDVIAHPGAVIILPFVDPDNILMIRNVRFATGRTLWELPAGTLENDEQPLETAQRELLEETGYQGRNFHFLTHFFTSPGFTNEVMYAFAAYDLVPLTQKLDAGEEITVEIISLKSACDMIKSGAIIDGKTIAALLFYRLISG